MPRYRIVLCCDGVPPASGQERADCITAGFRKRPWHSNAVCTWDGSVLTLLAENGFDHDGKALSDEFSDEISACVADGFDGDLRMVSVAVISP